MNFGWAKAALVKEGETLAENAIKKQAQALIEKDIINPVIADTGLSEIINEATVIEKTVVSVENFVTSSPPPSPVGQNNFKTELQSELKTAVVAELKGPVLKQAQNLVAQKLGISKYLPFLKTGFNLFKKVQKVIQQPKDLANDLALVKEVGGLVKKQCCHLKNEEQREPISIICEGTLFLKQPVEWRCIEKAILSQYAFLDIDLTSIHKIKIKQQTQLPDTHILKVCQLVADSFFSVPRAMRTEWFTKLFWAKMMRAGHKMDQNHQQVISVSGFIMKKSKIHGWEERFVSIDVDGLKSFKKIGTQPTVVLWNIPELWTRFQIVSDSFVVLKTFRSNYKMEFAVPINAAYQWVEAFCSLLRV